MAKKNIELAYSIPKDVYDQVMADLASPEESKITKKSELRSKMLCLERMSIKKCLRSPFTRPTFLEVAKLALEKQDWRVLYVILLQSLKTNDKLMIHEILEYMFVALSSDPMAAKLDSMRKFLMGCKLCKNDEEMETYIRNAYTLYDRDEMIKKAEGEPDEPNFMDEITDSDNGMLISKVDKVEE